MHHKLLEHIDNGGVVVVVMVLAAAMVIVWVPLQKIYYLKKFFSSRSLSL